MNYEFLRKLQESKGKIAGGGAVATPQRDTPNAVSMGSAYNPPAQGSESHSGSHGGHNVIQAANMSGSGANTSRPMRETTSFSGEFVYDQYMQPQTRTASSAAPSPAPTSFPASSHPSSSSASLSSSSVTTGRSSKGSSVRSGKKDEDEDDEDGEGEEGEVDGEGGEGMGHETINSKLITFQQLSMHFHLPINEVCMRVCECEGFAKI